MQILPINKVNFLLRIFNLILTFFIQYGIIHFGLKEPNVNHVIFKISAINFEFKVGYLLYFMMAFLINYWVILIISLLSFYKVQINTQMNEITFIALFSKRTISTNDIGEYFETVHTNPYKTFYGLLIKLKNEKTIQVTGQNIKLLSDLKDYLNNKKIVYAGQRKMKFPFN